MTNTCGLPSRSLMNAISLPSGENLGWLSLAGWTVSCRASPPVDDAIQMSPPQSKASRLPSGDSAGLLARRIGSRAAAGLLDKMTQPITNKIRFMADLGTRVTKRQSTDYADFADLKKKNREDSQRSQRPL